MGSSKNFSNPLRCGVDWPLSYPRLSIDHLGAGPRCPSEIFPVHQVNGSPKIRDHPCGRPMAGQPSAGSRPAVAPLKVTDHLQASQLSSNLQEAAARLADGLAETLGLSAHFAWDTAPAASSALDFLGDSHVGMPPKPLFRAPCPAASPAMVDAWGNRRGHHQFGVADIDTTPILTVFENWRSAGRETQLGIDKYRMTLSTTTATKKPTAVP